MLPSFVILFFCALVTAFSAGDPQEKWSGHGGHGGISHGGNNIGNGDVGGINGDVGIGGGSGGGCDPAACDAKCKNLGFPSGTCDNGGGSASLLGLILGGTTPNCVCQPITTSCTTTATATTTVTSSTCSTTSTTTATTTTTISSSTCSTTSTTTATTTSTATTTTTATSTTTTTVIPTAICFCCSSPQQPASGGLQGSCDPATSSTCTNPGNTNRFCCNGVTCTPS